MVLTGPTERVVSATGDGCVSAMTLSDSAFYLYFFFRSSSRFGFGFVCFLLTRCICLFIARLFVLLPLAGNGLSRGIWKRHRIPRRRRHSRIRSPSTPFRVASALKSVIYLKQSSAIRKLALCKYTYKFTAAN